ncbi:DALR anticodon-binding domain-containing protein 3-like isoform X1 [Bombyx mandarina]|uniref:DALR anticodon-binding domain-containing protein 3-like isoform X1 n=1 Tax=Bombyx mandarina TaxID=7092 RepID=A0A6J2J9N8_BOMMA|nr:DALR anticodon-binding domain-containing protein 3-like isoform X1 [Bombyx mandarina]
MLENVLEKFIDNLFLFITGKKKPNGCLLVKKHSDNLNTHGDISFPNTAKPWYGFLKCNSNEKNTLLENLNTSSLNLTNESRGWELQISKVTEDKERVYLFLDRSSAVRIGLLSALRNNNFISTRINVTVSTVSIDPACENTDCLTSLRVEYVKKTLANLCSVFEHPSSIVVSSKSSSNYTNSKRMLCGPVLNASTLVKEMTVTAKDLIKNRQEEMMSIAQHKYGVRISEDSKWKEFIDHLGESAVVFELLQTRPSSAVKINMNCSLMGSSKGASFILYNCARLETIIRTYNERISEGTYPSLPDFNETDFTLLTHEDEWYLIFNFILGLPSLLSSCVDLEGSKCEFKPHQICSFLCSMVRVFSQYYRKIRILTEPRKHLLPVMFARIHMLIILNDTLKTCLRILNIKSVSQM